MIESEIVAPGSLKAVLSGKHYNRCIRAHKLIYEAMERLRFQAFEKTLSTLKKVMFTQLVSASKKTKSDNGLWKSTRTTETSILKCCTTSLSRNKVKKIPYLHFGPTTSRWYSYCYFISERQEHQTGHYT